MTAGSMSLALAGHATHTRTGVLTAVLGLNGTDLGRIPLFDLGAATAQAGCAATTQFTLDPAPPGPFPPASVPQT